MMSRVLALVLALAAGGCPLPPPTPVSSTVAGVYDARLPAADDSPRVVTLWLQPGGAAVLETVYLGKARRPAENGTWTAQGDEVTVRLDRAQQPLVFTIDAARLVPKEWDQSLYGTTGLPLSRRAAYPSARKSIFEQPSPPPDGTP